MYGHSRTRDVIKSRPPCLLGTLNVAYRHPSLTTRIAARIPRMRTIQSDVSNSHSDDFPYNASNSDFVCFQS